MVLKIYFGLSRNNKISIRNIFKIFMAALSSISHAVRMKSLLTQCFTLNCLFLNGTIS